MQAIANSRPSMQKLMEPPPNVDERFARQYPAWIRAGFSAVGINLICLSVFIPLGLWWAVLAKALAIIIWVPSLMLLRKNRIVPALALALTDLISHSVLGVIFFGWEMGFQWFLIYTVINTYLLPKGFIILKSTILPLISLTFPLMWFYSQVNPALYPSPEWVQLVIFAINWFLFATMLAMNCDFYRQISEGLENTISQAYNKAEDLLLNILPQSIAQRLKTQDKTQTRRIIDNYQETSVLFCDIGGFSVIAQQIESTELIHQLDQLFCGIDDLCDRFDLEKIKTIGDSYMLCGGCPRSKPDHALRTVRCAYAILDLMEQSPLFTQHGLKLRIGIHSGPLVAGVIGRRKFTFDLWGDTVNIASRMESLGLPGRIHISDVTYKMIKKHYACTSQGNMDVKGIGLMETWLVEGNTEIA